MLKNTVKTTKGFFKKVSAKALMAKHSIQQAMQNDKGESHFVAWIVGILLVVVLGLVFKEQLSDLLNSALKNVKNQINGLLG